ncbi:PIN domain-containing protein [Mycolicibacterium sp. XJ870]
MSRPADAGVLDTSVFIANETGRAIDASAIPAQVATTVVTLAELNAGVLAATTTDVRAQRLATVDAVADLAILPVDEDAARMWARLRVYLAETGRRVRINDLWIAAIAASRGLPVITQDDDFDALDGAAGLTVIRV